MRRKQLNTLLVSFVTTFVVITAMVLLIWLVVWPRIQQIGRPTIMVNRDIVSFHQQFSLDPEITQIVMDDQLLREVAEPLVEYRGGNSYVFLSAGFLRDKFDPFLFWDESANTLFASTRTEMLEFTPNLTSFLVNGVSRTLETPIRRVDNEIFLPADLIQGLYPLIIEYEPEYNIVTITNALMPQTTGIVSVNNSAVRYRAEIRAPIAVQLEQGSEVIIFNEHVGSDFVYVRTPQGLLGWINMNEIDEITTVERVTARLPILPAWINNNENHPPMWNGGKINLVWEVATNQDANALLMQTPFHSSVTVISPTWFEFDMENLRLTSVVNRDYVEWAHAQGVYVWPKVFDHSNARARAILMNRNARREVIDQLIHYVDEFNLDGINIDIEHLLNAEEGPYKIQFLRELAIPMRERGVVLSAAVKVPEPWTMFYRRDLIAKTVDFVAVMSYDEHWATSPVSGPVASIPWVQRAIINMLEEVPREQLLLGIPAYNRIWREIPHDDGPPGVMSRSMDYTRAFFEERGVEWEWDSEVGSYYGHVSVMEDGQVVLYRVWLECERSVAAKMQIFVVHDLAGIGVWRRGWENDATWRVFERHFP